MRAVSGLRFHAYLPQYGGSFDSVLAKAKAAEEAGFEGVTFFDHLSHQLPIAGPIFDAVVTAACAGVRLQVAKIGHLCLCEAFRHPAVLAKQAASLDHATGGRFELGIGWGSTPDEIDSFGFGPTDPGTRIDRLRESLEVLKALWSGETVSYQGTYYSLRGAHQDPRPTIKIPIIIGGGGKRTRSLVAEHADWWNLRANELHQLEVGRSEIGHARLSIIELVGLQLHDVVDHRHDLHENPLLASGAKIGSPPELIEHFNDRIASGFERAYVWLVGAGPDTITAFGQTVISAFNV